MQYQVPQFIEREMKVVGPLTFKQVVFLAIGAGACLFLYFFLAPKSFFLFLVCCLPIGGVSLFLAFGKLEGRSLPIMLANAFTFLFSGRTYLWKKKVASSKALIFPKIPKVVEEKEIRTRVGGSKLENLASQLESGTKY